MTLLESLERLLVVFNDTNKNIRMVPHEMINYMSGQCINSDKIVKCTVFAMHIKKYNQECNYKYMMNAI